MIKFIILQFLISFPIFAYANTSCDLIARSKLSMSVHMSNFTNKNTTRTPEGGPYKYKELKCKKTCEIAELEKFKSVYEPGHPDADENGYVVSPDIDAAKEYKALSSDALTLKNFGGQCRDVSNIINNSNSVELEYIRGDIKRDTLNFKPNMDLISWERELADGSAETHNF